MRLYTLVLAVALTVPAISVAQTQLADDVVTVELDVFSGRANPSFELSLAELSDLLAVSAPVCTKTALVDASAYPDAFLGYRGIKITRGKRGSRGKPLAELARKRVKLARTDGQVLCGARLAQATSDLSVADDSAAVEKHLVEVARKKGAIPDELQQAILRTIETAR